MQSTKHVAWAEPDVGSAKKAARIPHPCECAIDRLCFGDFGNTKFTPLHVGWHSKTVTGSGLLDVLRSAKGLASMLHRDALK